VGIVQAFMELWPNEVCDTPSTNISFYTLKLHPEHNAMSLDQYNQLISDMLNERRALAKSRIELKERGGRLCRHCGKFGHIA